MYVHGVAVAPVAFLEKLVIDARSCHAFENRSSFSRFPSSRVLCLPYHVFNNTACKLLSYDITPALLSAIVDVDCTDLVK